MCHVTKYCNVIGPHCTVWQDMARIHAQFIRPFPFLWMWVWLVRLLGVYGLKYHRRLVFSDTQHNWKTIVEFLSVKLFDSGKDVVRPIKRDWTCRNATCRRIGRAKVVSQARPTFTKKGRVWWTVHVYEPCPAILYSAVQSHYNILSHDTLHHCSINSL